MKDLIKIIIALAFIACAFVVGKYLADEKCSIQLKEMNERSADDKKQILQLQENVTILKMEIEKINSAKLTDSSKKTKK